MLSDRFCICSRWATQRKTQESVLCVLAILEIRSSKQRMKMFVYGLSQCLDVCFRSQGCGVVHVYLLGPFSHDSPEPWIKSEGSPGFHKLPRGDILGRNAHITWPWVSILHTMLPQCQRTERERDFETDGHKREDNKSKRAWTLHMISTCACRNSASAHYCGTRKTLNQEDWGRVKERGGEREGGKSPRRARESKQGGERVGALGEKEEVQQKRLEVITCGRGGCALSNGEGQNRR